MSETILPGSEPYRYDGGRQGVLVLHGFTGSPQSMRPLSDRLAGAGFSVSLPLLPGHGTSVEDLATKTWSDWSNAALKAYDELASRCDVVGVCGLSMGGGLAAWISERREVGACALINPIVMSPGSEMEEGIRALLNEGVATIDAIGSDIKREGGVELSYPATPLASALSLFEGLHDVERDLEKINASVLLLSSREDHVVAPINGDVLVERVSGPVRREWLENSYHVATLDNDQERLESLAEEFFAGELSR